MALEDKARELGRMIGQSDEYRAVTRANEGLANDAEATAVLRQMETLRLDAQSMLQRGEEPTKDMEQQLDDLLTKVQGSPSYQRVAVAQENLDKVMRLVNDWISDGITKGAQSSIITLG
ncbi:MAG: YlbF family regulator [Gemmatimonadota bacterium]|nr:YlbF family regulator [Gemmatimonadota bacterium]